MEGPATKLFQRKLYSWLSSRRGLPLCIIGLLVLAISAFQFGEILLEWSKERYSAQFSIYHDNIGGRSFEKYLTPDLPIDIVYTWVNGSDPRLLAQIKELRHKMTLEEQRKKEAKNTVNDSSMNDLPAVESCPFKNCVPWKCLVIDASNLSSSLSVTLFHQLFPNLTHIKELLYFNLTGHNLHPGYGVRMETENQVSTYLRSPSLITSTQGLNVSLTRGFLTSDGSLVGSVPLSQFIMITSPRLLPGDTEVHRLLMETLKDLTSGHISELELVNRGVGVAQVRDGNWDRVWSKNTTFRNRSLTFHKTYAIWMPFKLGKDNNRDKKGSDVISQNRFQDNEELRYSLRSVERYAPWVRHIYIVTNGQIPHWINLDNPRISIVTHHDIFLNKSHLPSFSSPSIESHLHRIPGLSKWFLYLNDDVMFGQEVWPHDFFTPDGGQKIYLSWAVPNCAEGCPSNWINDKYCDKACNVSACDWDGDDCINATRPGPVGGGGGRFWSHTQSYSLDYCSTGCLNTWVGDRYCDSACNVASCGYDGGDCGTDNFHEIYSITITTSTPPNSSFTIPLETVAMFFNLSIIFHNKTISSAVRSSSPIIRTAIVSQRHKTLSITFSKNTTLHSAHFIIKGKSGEQVQFSVIADTVTRNTSLAHLAKDAIDGWSFPAYNDSSQQKFLDTIALKVQDVDKTISYWVTEKPTLSSSVTPVISFVNYTLSNISILPLPIATKLKQYIQEFKDGELTQKGFLKKQALLLEPYARLPGVRRTKVIFGGTKNSSVTKNSNTDHDSPYVEISHKGTRHLMTTDNFPSSRLPWERYNIFPNMPSDIYQITNRIGRKLMDTFADSLRHVNMLYTRAYGHKSRKVPAHMPHMINKEIMEELQQKYKDEFDKTSSHKLRSVDDMQFAFSYFYYIIEEKETLSLHDIFKKLDTDKSGILSVRELRTLLVKTVDLPLTAGKIDDFEKMLRHCSNLYNTSMPSVDPIEFETHYDPDLPLVTEDFIANCSELMKKINKAYSSKNKYSYQETSEDQIQFKMLVDNSSKVLTKLDEVRKDQRKFICLNDNMDHNKEDTKLSQLLLQDFYESLFPLPSQFELPSNLRNRFLFVEDLNEWLHTRWKMQLILQCIFCALVVMCLVSLFYGKIIQWKRRFLRFIVSCFYGDRNRRTSSV